ncbi:PepSY domain-containing protein [Neopusillimonas aromaticivorans]|uniref:PepSY domain-containing protein n=1 Tax=Neopusillimonas aromaticivorans TaxID=2979868 RepID=UPI00259A67D0|nr:PepSY domain-containing protein [Neopusillimonas aromaticivorans]WJJ92676.1 PepSY domain-containing protein [Neopusillimonas aromaticivorans]
MKIPFSLNRLLPLAVAVMALVVSVGALLPATVFADDDDHDRARQALLAGKVLSLRDVLDKVMADYPGEPVEIEFEEDDGVYEYEIKLLQPAGNIIKLKVDASTGEVIGLKGRGVQFKEKNNAGAGC